MYTYGGDADLNGKLNGDDYFQIDSHVNVAGSTGYHNGDFNYNGIVNGDDYFIIDSAFPTGSTGPQFPTSGGAVGGSLPAIRDRLGPEGQMGAEEAVPGVAPGPSKSVSEIFGRRPTKATSTTPITTAIRNVQMPW